MLCSSFVPVSPIPLCKQCAWKRNFICWSGVYPVRRYLSHINNKFHFYSRGKCSPKQRDSGSLGAKIYLCIYFLFSSSACIKFWCEIHVMRFVCVTTKMARLNNGKSRWQCYPNSIEPMPTMNMYVYINAQRNCFVAIEPSIPDEHYFRWVKSS